MNLLLHKRINAEMASQLDGGKGVVMRRVGYEFKCDPTKDSSKALKTYKINLKSSQNLSITLKSSQKNSSQPKDHLIS